MPPDGQTRRHFLTGLPLLPIARGAASPLELRLLPDEEAITLALQPGADTTRIVFAGAAAKQLRPIELPSAELRLSGRLAFAGREMLLTSFPATEALDVLAIIGWDGGCLRILGLEPLSVRSAEGPRLSLRVTANNTEPTVHLTYELSAPRGPTLPFHLEWIDTLGFRPLSPLADTATRPPLAGGCQARLAQLRANVITMLKTHSIAITQADLANSGLLGVPHQLALATGAAPYATDRDDP
jgi:hypothetical protein